MLPVRHAEFSAMSMHHCGMSRMASTHIINSNIFGQPEIEVYTFCHRHDNVSCFKTV